MLTAFISDIHSNLEALQAVLKKIDEMKIERIYCLGDIVGYGAQPCECIKIIKDRKIPSVLGNHDLASVSGDTSFFNPVAARAVVWTSAKLHLDEIEFLKNLPEKLELTLNNLKVLLVHGSPRDPIWEYVFPENVDENFVKDLDFDVVIMGHTHVPFVKKFRKILVANCGAVGQPRDHDPRASFLVLDTKKVEAEIVRVKYDVKNATQKIIDAGLPKLLAERLYLGM
jgi:putative phosphoesterase